MSLFNKINIQVIDQLFVIKQNLILNKSNLQQRISLKFINKMQKLLSSRTKRDQELISVGNLSPQKYGKSAFCNLQYTPSKLVDNVLYKQVTTLKKVQQEVIKNRQFQAINDCLMDKLKYMQEQKNVIINSLNQQITVYKRIIKEMQTKNQQRIKQLQRKFKQELNKLILNKQEEVKFIQSQKQLLQERIIQLQKLNQELQQKINNHQKSVSDIKNGYEKMQKEIQNLNYKIKQKSQQIKQLQENNRKDVEELQRKLLNSEMTWQSQLRDAINRKQLEIETIQKGHKLQLNQIDNLRVMQMESHKNQKSDIIHSYEKQLKKYSEIIMSKQRAIQTLTKEHRQEKSKNLNLTKTYETELNDFNNLKILIAQLERENDKLRDLLIESSKELQRCRQQFLTLDRQNDSLRIKLKSSQQESRTWRQSYYMTKRH